MIRASGMACLRFKSEHPNAEVGDGTRQMSIISQLEGVPHVLEQTIQHLNAVTVDQLDFPKGNLFIGKLTHVSDMIVILSLSFV